MLPARGRNVFLLTVSLLFYAWGEGAYLLMMLLSIVSNWYGGLLIGGASSVLQRKIFLLVAVVFNLLPLLLFKYAFFFSNSLNVFLQAFNIPWSVNTISLHLPIGISFFTFQALSYVIDVYRKTSVPQKNIIHIGLYISLFPQLIAGPIVRYHDIAREIISRKVSIKLFHEGVYRFVTGLAKKVLLANPLAVIRYIY